MGTAIKRPVPDRVKLSFVIFDIRALWRSALSVRVLGCQKLQMTKWLLNPVWHRMLYSCTHMATVGVKGLNHSSTCTLGDRFTGSGQQVPSSIDSNKYKLWPIISSLPCPFFPSMSFLPFHVLPSFSCSFSFYSFWSSWFTFRLNEYILCILFSYFATNTLADWLRDLLSHLFKWISGETASRRLRLSQIACLNTRALKRYEFSTVKSGLFV